MTEYDGPDGSPFLLWLFVILTFLSSCSSCDKLDRLEVLESKIDALKAAQGSTKNGGPCPG